MYSLEYKESDGNKSSASADITQGAQFAQQQSIALTKPCLECGSEQPVSRAQYERNTYFPLCNKCRVRYARLSCGIKEEK